MIERELYHTDKYNVVHGWSGVEHYQPFFTTTGEGCIVYADCGARDIGFLDLRSGCFNLLFGYTYEPVINAIKKQLDILPFSYDAHEPRARLTRELLRITSGDFESVFFSPAGSLAVEFALMTAKFLTGRQKILHFDGSYHGASEGSRIVCGIDAYRIPAHPDVVRLPLPDCLRCQQKPCNLSCLSRIKAEVSRQGAEGFAAAVFEPVSWSRVVIPDAPFWPGFVAFCREKGILTIADEIVTGFGRTGSLFAYQGMGFVPDMMCISKGMTAGYLPLAATLMSGELSECIRRIPIAVGYSYEGYPLGCAAALAVVEELCSGKFTAQVLEKGRIFLELLREKLSGIPIVGDVRGRGLFIGIEIVRDKKTLARADREILEEIGKRAKKHKLLIDTNVDNVLIVMPPYIISLEQVTEATEKIAIVCNEVAADFIAV